MREEHFNSNQEEYKDAFLPRVLGGVGMIDVNMVGVNGN